MTHEVEDLERRGWEALSSPQGRSFYAEHMADDGLMLFPGMVLDKERVLGAIADAEPWASFELDDVRVIEPAADAAIVTYRATAHRQDAGTYRAMMASVYGRRQGRWLLVLHQQTPDPAA